jgi:uncharacterized protein YdhG (YjbR/CyaY superfamily)
LEWAEITLRPNERGQLHARFWSLSYMVGSLSCMPPRVWQKPLKDGVEWWEAPLKWYITDPQKWQTELAFLVADHSYEEVSMSSKKETQKSDGFTAEERAAMKERAGELKAEKEKADLESDLLAKIAEMSEPDRSMAERIHTIVKANAPTLTPKTWYGMPAYAKDGKVVCFFQCASKFNARYATLGFNDPANLDEGQMWPTSFALKALTAIEEAQIIALVKKAVS